MAAAPSDIFSITYDAVQQLLIGHWLHDSGDDDLYPSYDRLLAAAKENDKCRFWLLDMRRRNWHTETFTKWFTEFLTNQAVRELGSPIFIAYVAAEEHRADIESVTTEAMLLQAAQAEFYPFFFNNEAAAYDWLVYYHSHPSTKPAAPTT